jgi:(2Fe-2S) ferredoxin
MSRFKHHVFVCINQRPPDNPKGCCAAKGGESYLEQFKAEIKRLGLKRSVRANRAGCLDACSFGPCLVIYPEGVWYRVENSGDVLEIIEKHIQKGEPVERLKIPVQSL